MESSINPLIYFCFLHKPTLLLINFIFLRLYSFIHERHRERERERQRHRQKEKQAPHRKPDVGLDPGTWGSLPELKADAQSLSHSGVPTFNPSIDVFIRTVRLLISNRIFG